MFSRVRLTVAIAMTAAGACGFPSLPTLSADAAAVDGAPPALELRLLAGNMGGPGNIDGVGTGARFSHPQAAVVDSAGNLFVGDAGTTIRKITRTGQVTTFAGTYGVTGNADGMGAAATFLSITAIAIDGANNLYVVDGNSIRTITPAGLVSTYAGAADPGSADGTGAVARFRSPTGIAVAHNGTIYVADTGNNTIRKIAPGAIVTTFAGTSGFSGSGDAVGTAARFSSPAGLAIDDQTLMNLYVCDRSNGTVRQIGLSSASVTTLAGNVNQRGTADGVGTAAQFLSPIAAAVDPGYALYVTDGYELRRIRFADRAVTTLAGSPQPSGAIDGIGAAARFAYPSGITRRSGTLYVADSGASTIRSVQESNASVGTFAGAARVDGSTDGFGTSAGFASPSGAAVAGDRILVTDTNNGTLRAVTEDGLVTTILGVAGSHATIDGPVDAARLSWPLGPVVDGSGDVYLLDGNELRRFSSTMLGAVAGNGTPGTADGTATSARLSSPSGPVTSSSLGAVAISPGGPTVYITDNQTIRKISIVGSAGMVSTIAGAFSSEGSDNGTGIEARFRTPSGIAVDGAGVVFVADTFNHTIRRVSSTGEVTTVAGTAGVTGLRDGAAADALFREPCGIASDTRGNLYVSERANATIRKITPAGVVTTIAGDAKQHGIVLGSRPGFGVPCGLEIAGEDLVVIDGNAILLLIGAVTP